MRRVAITGMGITSCLGNDLDTVSRALREGRAGIRTNPEAAEHGLRSQVAGDVQLDLEALVDRKLKRFMGDASAYAYLALRDAIADAGLDEAVVSDVRTGLIAGSGGGSSHWQVAAADLLRNRGVRKVGPYMVPRTMCSAVSANLATAFKIKGVSYSLSAACATSAHCIGAAADLIRHGQQDVMFAGGGEELDWTMSLMFDAMGALSSGFNERPAVASRPYDAERDGFVIAAGGGMLVLEDYERAVARGARIHAELLGYGVTSDGADMVAPSGEGAVRCMQMAMQGVAAPIDYLNTHGTSTPLGDVTELGAVRDVFGDAMPPLSSTKALSGHSLGAASVHEAIYCLLMMRDGFIAGSANIDALDPRAEGFPIVRESREATLRTVMSNSFGFGGTNAALVFGRV
ncbi:beta-ketoacyl-ACP synthase I [Xanthomonas graminis]|jgi:3-oxoacyl-[acyl-carrier-protein] synthase-1|uniref:3-oxoacyl-[acyl-carrier-protein] synthase 1 n=1 Tax=Xanthomonas graminis pv. graminis TaxID=134874 RepID=A0A1M4JLY4_9XANT|nr:beta-ketoacyl-ACP synthase I [Xanthomonas translucens]EKU23798.1 3-oxoacyl-[acyl-carrier protein] synthase II [Xanthomonas translucens pv. graminis ART-Xtg29]OAX58301.1 beta-ketoacyl-[acyl-carrier-protein] synthase I [Xanthomonas translucens pv. graminis]UKE54168.1 beta-ketoacyl-ACP synthase I [Xanthomonas translucens pv. graminis]WIH09145.1 beta-ketoacyl-ACP synthase I [Xanthomonas translucens pv. graminis]WIH12070.1 beta-ketoacyl-ACP synthase I [Xanthomonas translucens pv. graminis]